VAGRGTGPGRCEATCQEVIVSQVRVHNFSVSLDGFGTGAGQSLDAPFGHAGTRLRLSAQGRHFLVTEILADWVDEMSLDGHVYWSAHPPGSATRPMRTR
jgi:hypothetical protein